MSNWYVSTHPKSLFVNSLIAARPAADCRYALRNNHFAIHHLKGATEQHLLTTAQDICAVLTNQFRLTLPASREVEKALQQFVEPADSDDSP